ncbi:MAG: hypothetical protein JST51_08410 [Armatimonadetes bacterium]|nr:hypothetical protein [Armatimonadota bacterium]
MPSEPMEFKLGKLRGFVDPESGQLRYLKVGPYELLRGIYGSVRRPDWGTVVQTVSDFKFDRKRESFSCTFVAAHKDDKMDFTWHGTITGKVRDDGKAEIEYVLDGIVPVEQMTNRLGLCLLHPATLEGIPAQIEHDPGKIETIPFPEVIKADQPFKDTKAISYEVKPGIGIRIELSGDDFETEDQRNYGDASYKTYCHWQESGSPYRVTKGQEIKQKARLIVSADGYKDEPTIPTASSGQLPSLGTIFRRKMTVEEMDHIMSLHLTHSQASLEGIESAKLVGGPVFLQTQAASIPVTLSPNDGILFSPVNQWKKLNAVRGAKKFLAVQGWFMEMNGSKPSFDGLDGSSLGLQPKTHQFDTDTMMECGWVVPDQVKSARHMGAKTIVVGPARLSDAPDARTNGIEAAIFTMAVIANAVKAKADFVTLFDSEVLLKSPASLPLALLADRRSNDIRVWDVNREFVMIECGKMILANLSWEPSEYFKQIPFDSADNLAVGIKGEYHLFDQDNVANWKQVLTEPAKHSILSALPPRSIVVLG